MLSLCFCSLKRERERRERGESSKQEQVDALIQAMREANQLLTMREAEYVHFDVCM